jgi:RHS repeat-associated protein
MTGVQTFMPTNPVTYAPVSGEPSNMGVPFTQNPSLSAGYSYDVDDRLSTVNWVSAGTTTSYGYQTGSNHLDHVAGTIEPGSTRDASVTGNFAYDADGEMVSDHSSAKSIAYGQYGLPVSFQSTIGITFPIVEADFPLYDADNQMVSYVGTVNSLPFEGIAGKYHYFRIGGFCHKELSESWNPNTTANTYNSTSEILNLRGQNSVVGRKFPGTTIQRQFYVKDHQGSTIRIVNDDGTTAGGYDYYAYGDVRTLSGESTNLTEKYTGKEYFPALGLDYFGARWYDPELGIWTGPDPKHQFNSPYAFGSAPIMGVDQDGRLFGWDDLVAAVVGGTLSYISGGLHNGNWFNLRAAENFANGAVSADAGWNTGLITTAATGGCFVCGYAAGSLVGTTAYSFLNNAETGWNSGWNTGIGPLNYNWNGGGLSVAKFNSSASITGVFDNVMTGMSYASVGVAAYGTYGSYTRGSLGFQNPFSSSSEWSLNGSLSNFQQQSAASYAAANQSVQNAYNSIRSNFDFKFGSQDATSTNFESNPQNIANGPRLAAQLRAEEESSTLNPDGTLDPDVVNQSRMIIPGDALRDQSVIDALTSDGSNIGDWAKMTSQQFVGPNGAFQWHFYQNLNTKEINYFDIKQKY